MRRRRLFRLLCISLLVLLVVAGLVVLPVVRELRQEAKNRALIAAVKANDASAVVRLLEAGADANARDLPKDPRPFWRKLWDSFRQKQQAETHWTPTAL